MVYEDSDNNNKKSVLIGILNISLYLAEYPKLNLLSDLFITSTIILNFFFRFIESNIIKFYAMCTLYLDITADAKVCSWGLTCVSQQEQSSVVFNIKKHFLLARDPTWGKALCLHICSTHLRAALTRSQLETIKVLYTIKCRR